jgi:shikimate kinase
MIVYLIGYMGSGKSRYGRAAASILGWQFLDLDLLIEHAAGMSIPEIFAQFSEAHFRQVEHQMLTTTLPTQPTIVATGGGAPCVDENLNFMIQHGKLLYLRLHPSSLVSRLETRIAGRPMLAPHAEQPEAFITQHLAEREPWYLQAHRVVKGEGLTGKKLAEEIRQMLDLM